MSSLLVKSDFLLNDTFALAILEKVRCFVLILHEAKRGIQGNISNLYEACLLLGRPTLESSPLVWK